MLSTTPFSALTEIQKPLHFFVANELFQPYMFPINEMLVIALYTIRASMVNFQMSYIA